ncbi:hypothetical protein L2291_04530 [Lactobacillus gasseri]|nr:hypothetical protein [Lactobacillus gasseri]MCZ3960299.1 hypothetical protein [Lactobacillus gasseri]MCZ3962137.1 hypothetical protein [Lactobacillus gasseri]MCZ3965956.1 hypothetical protein [Lactobacillus gasseri]MCZ3976940.1 hypothetical protein [Lactobacillus gasseri]
MPKIATALIAATSNPPITTNGLTAFPSVSGNCVATETGLEVFLLFFLLSLELFTTLTFFSVTVVEPRSLTTTSLFAFSSLLLFVLTLAVDFSTSSFKLLLCLLASDEDIEV